MKKSDMLEIIRHGIRYSIYSGEPVHEAVLNTILKAGMLPPDRALCHPELDHTDYTWEPEDD